MSSEGWNKNQSSLDRQLDTLMAQTMKVEVPEELIRRTMERVPKTLPLLFPWWAWVVYVGFFTATLFGLIYGQWEALASLATGAALMAPRAIALAVQYPYLAAAVTGAFFLNALIVWFLTADAVLRKRFAGVVTS
ncbi:MAG: hypothetical protein HY315_06330 [Acidobacteria bacterium]|nr:hypothetical protein [Acidobacteriota bacterium]